MYMKVKSHADMKLQQETPYSKKKNNVRMEIEICTMD